jgi:hypothetical protein
MAAARELGEVPPRRQGHVLCFVKAVKHSKAYSRIAALPHTTQITITSSGECDSRCGF